jgi:hypothetical protein
LGVFAGFTPETSPAPKKFRLPPTSLALNNPAKPLLQNTNHQKTPASNWKNRG